MIALLRLVAGEKEKNCRKNTVFIGECAKSLAKHFYVEGCSPEKKEIEKVLEGFFQI